MQRRTDAGLSGFLPSCGKSAPAAAFSFARVMQDRLRRIPCPYSSPARRGQDMQRQKSLPPHARPPENRQKLHGYEKPRSPSQTKIMQRVEKVILYKRIPRKPTVSPSRFTSLPSTDLPRHQQPSAQDTPYMRGTCTAAMTLIHRQARLTPEGLSSRTKAV